jgi:hypothetical protein
MRVVSILFVWVLMALPFTTYPATTPPVCSSIEPKTSTEKLSSLKVREVQRALGRKLTLKEKLSLFILKHAGKKASSKKGNTAMIFGIIGLGLLVLGLFVPYIILGAIVAAIIAVVLGSVARKTDPSDKKAMAGLLLGWITLGLAVLFLLLAFIYFASGAWI